MPISPRAMAPTWCLSVREQRRRQPSAWRSSGSWDGYTQVGIFGSPLRIDMDQVVIKQLHVQGSMCHTWETWERTLRFLRQDLIDLDPFISGRLGLSHWEEAFENVLAKKGVKFLLYPEE